MIIKAMGFLFDEQEYFNLLCDMNEMYDTQLNTKQIKQLVKQKKIEIKNEQYKSYCNSKSK